MTDKIFILVLFLILLPVSVYFVLSSRKVNYVAGASVLSITASPPPPGVTPTPTPISKQTIRFGIVVDDYANRLQTITKLEQTLNQQFTTVSIFKQFGNSNNYLNPDDMAFIKSSGKKLLIAWEPWNPSDGVNQKEDYLPRITAGQYDSYITRFADQVKNYSAPVTVRFGHEMNGNWYPWGQRPADYIGAYRRIFEIFKSQNVTNVTWMWSVNVEPLSQISRYYPGDIYVDNIGIDGFNWGTSRPGAKWTGFTDLFLPSYLLLTSLYDKPIVISETASSDVGGNKGLWIRDMMSALPVKFPEIGDIIWFNLNKETDWRIDSYSSDLKSR